MVAHVFYIGIDLGGTTCKALAVTPTGRVLGRAQAPSALRDRDLVVQDIVAMLRQLTADVTTAAQELAAVGFAIAGLMALPSGRLHAAPNLPTWQGTDLRALFQAYLKVPFVIDNDANAAVLGEAWMGAGQGLRHVVMVTLGTGIGGGVLVDGAILHGANGYAGELGHTVVHPEGPKCRCGSYGCLEQYASGRAIARMAKPYYGEITAAVLAAAARRGERQALDVFRQAGYHLGIACANFANLFNPQCIIIGGAVANAFDLFIEPLQAAMRQRAFADVYNGLRVVPASRGADAGAFGAAYLAMRQAAA